MVQAVVMAGGRGERLRPLTLQRPKPLVPLFGRPLLGYLVRHLHERGVEEVFVTAGHLGAQIAAYLETLPTDLRLRCHVERQPRGTAGAVFDLLPHLRSPFLVVSGDAVLDLDVEALVQAHRTDGNAATICLAPPGERLRFGTVAVSGRQVQRFVEKPPLAELLPEASINTGCYVLDREALRETAADGLVDFATDVFPHLLARGARLGAVAAARYWRDIGTLEAYREAHFEGLAGRLPWAIPAGGSLSGDGLVRTGSGVRLGPGARVAGPAVIGDGCRIGAQATVEGSVLLDGCRVGPGAMVRDCVLEAGACVPSGVRLVAAGVAGGAATRLRRQRQGRRQAPAAGGAAAEGLAFAAPPQ